MSGNQIVMGGRGFYNAHSQLQHSAIRFGLPYLERALAVSPLPRAGRPFLVADYGSSEGRNSLEVMSIIIRTMRERASASLPFTIVHVDQPANDFSSLFTLLQSSPASYLRDTSGVFAYATGGTFYGRVFPDNQVCLGWSALAVHWLSRLPAVVPGHISTGHATPQQLSVFAEQASQDWRSFLEHRACELESGACLVVLAGSADPQGRYGGEPLYEIANRVLQDLVREGRLRGQEYERMTVPTYHRTLEEFAEPMQAGPLHGRLKLLAQSQAIMPDPLWEAHGAAGDIQSFAVKQTGWLRAWSEASLFRHLDGDRNMEAVCELVEEFYGRVRQAIEDDPPSARCAWRLASLLIVKT